MFLFLRTAQETLVFGLLRLSIVKNTNKQREEICEHSLSCEETLQSFFSTQFTVIVVSGECQVVRSNAIPGSRTKSASEIVDLT